MSWLYKYISKCLPLIVLTGLILLSFGGCAKIGMQRGIPVLSFRTVHTYPHDPTAFTQGLVIDNGVLYESTGLYSRSSLRRVDLESGKILQQHNLPPQYFGEGITVFGSRIIQLTWKFGVGFIYDKNTFEPLGSFTYPGEGWGITHDGKSLIMSDGSATIRFLNPNTFAEERRINVADETGPVPLLNELEYVRGTIYANVWETNRIALIDPGTGKVKGWLDLTDILPEESLSNRPPGVLNGIAYDADKEAMYITGKLWPLLFHIEIL